MAIIDGPRVTINGLTLTEQTVVPATPSSGKQVLYISASGLSLVDSSGNINFPNKYIAEGRLTLESGVPVSTTDQAAKTTLYYTPYVGDQISLFDGAKWGIFNFSELSISVPATASQMYDVFIYNNGGSATLELTAWTNDTTRATSLVRQNGVLCKSGALTRRYVGSFRTTGTSGQTEDSLTKRFVWNMYHRIQRNMLRKDTTANWTYNSNTWRQTNGATANKIEIVTGVAEEHLEVKTTMRILEGTNQGGMIGLGINSTNTNSSDATGFGYGVYPQQSSVTAFLNIVPAIGYNYISSLERCGGAYTITFLSNDSGDQFMMLSALWRC